MALGSPLTEVRRLRRARLLEAAARAEMLVVVSSADAEASRAEWRAALRAASPRPLRLLRPARGIPRLSRPPLPSELPPAGTWISFRPHITSAPEVFKVLGYVPVGSSITDHLAADQVRLLQDGTRLRCVHGDRVILGEPGGMHLISSIRTALAGAVAARAVVITEPVVASASRLISPLSAGSSVDWMWHSSFGPSKRSGVVVAYIPGGTPVAEAAPGVAISGKVRSVSNLDRYLVRVHGANIYLTPPAFLVERPSQEAPCSAPSPSS